MSSVNALFARFVTLFTRLSLSLVFVIASVLPAIAKDFYFDSVLDTHGNTINNVRSLFNDKQGYLWLGGDAGVYRFDGYNVLNVNSEPTRGLFMDNSGRLWSAGTITLAALTPDTFTPILYPNLSNKTQKPDYEVINHMIHTQDNRQFFATNEGLSEYIQTQDKFLNYNLTVQVNATKQSIAVTALFQSSDTTLMVGTSQGLFSLPLALINHTNSTIPLSKAIIPAIQVSDIVAGPDNTLLVGSNNGFYTIESNGNTIHHFTHDKTDINSISSNNITRILADDHGYIWLGTGKGLNVLAPNSQRFIRFMHNAKKAGSINNNLITDLYQQNNGTILIATYSGINRFHHQDVHLGMFQTGQSSIKSVNNVWSLQQDNQKNLWVGTFGEGLLRINQHSSKRFETNINDKNSLASNRISSLLFDNKNQLWVGSTKGLQLFDPLTERFTTINQVDSRTIFEISQGPDDTLWLASLSGIIRVAKDRLTATYFNKNSAVKVPYKQWVRAVLPIDHRILAGSDKGLHVLDLNAHTTHHFEEVGSVIKIFNDSSSNIWVLTMTGIMLFDLEQQSVQQILAQKQPFTNQTQAASGCNSISEDSFKQLWLVCEEGLKVIDIISKQFIAHYNKSDGVDLSGFLTGSQSMITTTEGDILLGERKGISRFVPSVQKGPVQQGNVALTQVNFFSSSAPLNDPQNPFNLAKHDKVKTLPYQMQKVEFQFSSLDLARPKSSQYRYQLAGFEQSWTSTTADNRRAIYTNLPSGEYTFKLQALSSGKTLNAIEYPFVITPKPWQTWWARVLYTVFILLFVYWLIKLSTRSLSKRSTALEQRIALRTGELQQSKQEVEQLMAEREKLIENIYHQTRTPLQIMLGNINALVADELTIDAYADKQTTKVNALVHLTDQILDVSRITRVEQGALQPVDLSALLKPMILGIIDVAKAKNLQFEGTIDEVMTVRGLPNSLENAIDNILTNAIKYTDEGGIRFSATEQAGTIVIQCSDTGIGIPKNDQQNVFKRYQRAANVDEREGAGIGLAMVKDVIDALGGELTLSSEVNKGTTVKITLPAVISPATQDIPEYQMLESQLDTDSEQTSQLSILIVEDNLELVGYLAKLLSVDYQVLTALNGQDGLKQARQQVPDLIISDVMMAPMDGYELTRQVRKDDIICHIPILLVTAKSDDASKEHGFALGASDFITKPFKAPDLLNRVSNQLQQIKTIQQRTHKNESFTQDSEEDRLITRYLQFVSKHYQDNDVKIKDACGALHISIRQLERKVRHFLNMTPNELLNDYRLSRAQELVKQGCNAGDVYHQCGFSSHAYFSKRYKEKFGHLPSQHKSATKSK